jgi:hypothetical protein
MTVCVKCGHDPEAVVAASWAFTIDRKPPSLNNHVINVGVTRFAYGRERDAWMWEFRAVRLLQRIPKAVLRRRVTLTRIYAGREREWDRDNFSGGAKPVVDAMVLEGLIEDDSSASAEIYYAQERGARAGLRVNIEELAA